MKKVFSIWCDGFQNVTEVDNVWNKNRKELSLATFSHMDTVISIFRNRATEDRRFQNIHNLQ